MSGAVEMTNTDLLSAWNDLLARYRGAQEILIAWADINPRPERGFSDEDADPGGKIWGAWAEGFDKAVRPMAAVRDELSEAPAPHLAAVGIKLQLSDPSLIARHLVADSPYFISHGSALELHRMVTQPQLSTTVSCTKRLRPQNIHGYEFRFIQVSEDRLFGLTDFWVTPEDAVRISDPERTIVDGLDLPQYVGGVAEIAKGLWMKRDSLDVPRLIDYALRLEAGAVIRRLGYLLELYDMADRQRLEALRIKLTPTYQRLDPLLPNEGPMLSRWRIRLNLEPDELAAVRSS